MPATLDDRTAVTFIVAGRRLDGDSKRGGGASSPVAPPMGLPVFAPQWREQGKMDGLELQ